MKMVKNSILIVCGIILCCFSVASLSLSMDQEETYQALIGEWDVQTEDGQYTFVFIFSMEEETLKGIYKGMSGEVEMEDLEFEDNGLSFTVNINAGGQAMEIDFSATIDGDALEGYLSMEYGEANITGKKRK